MNNDYTVLIVIGVIVIAAFLYSQSRKKKKGDKPSVGQQGGGTGPTSPPHITPVPSTPPANPTPTPNPNPTPPAPTPTPGLVDRLGKHEGDPGYDPRMVRPDPEPSPEEPVGTYYGEGPFNPNGRWIDIKGGYHNFG